MRSIEEILEEKHRQAVRVVLDSGISIQKAEAFYLADKFKEILLEALTEMSTGVPRITEDVYRLQAYNHKSIVGRHLVDGRWRHIAQIFNVDGSIKYYTDAKREHDRRGSH